MNAVPSHLKGFIAIIAEEVVRQIEAEERAALEAQRNATLSSPPRPAPCPSIA
jgi:hypothetical protein